MKRHRLLPNLLISCLLLSVGVAADFDAGVDAYNAGDYETALHEFKLSAEAGSAVSSTRMGMIYYVGEGVLLFFDALEPLAMFISCQLLHIGNGVAFINNLSAQQRLNGVL